MKQQAGYTIIEMVVVILMFTMCVVVLTSLFIGQNRIYNTETAELNITGDAQTALDDIDNYVKQGNRALGSYSTYTAGSQVLILQILSVNASNQLVAGTYDDVVYYLTSGSLYRRVFPNAASTRIATTKKIANNVNSLTFSYYSDTNITADYSLVNQIQTDITLLQTGFQNRTITLTNRSKLRNY